MSVLSGKKIVLGISGGIAAYKTAHLVRLFIKAGAQIQVIMTPASKDFITPLTLILFILPFIMKTTRTLNGTIMSNQGFGPISCSSLQQLPTHFLKWLMAIAIICSSQRICQPNVRFISHLRWIWICTNIHQRYQVLTYSANLATS